MQVAQVKKKKVYIVSTSLALLSFSFFVHLFFFSQFSLKHTFIIFPEMHVITCAGAGTHASKSGLHLQFTANAKS